MSKFVVAGVTGHVGSAVARELLNAGDQVIGIVREAKKGADLQARGAKLAVGSLDDPDFIATTVKGADGAVMIVPPHYDVADIYAAQRRTADALAAGVKKGGVPLVVLISSVGGELADRNGPIKGLHYAEVKLRETGTKLVALRSAYFQENIAGMIGGAKQAGIYPNFLPTPDVPLPQASTRDVGSAAARLLRSPPARSEVVDLIGLPYTARQLADKLGERLGKKLSIVNVPAEGRVTAMEQAGIPSAAARAFAEMYGGFAAGLLVPKGDRSIQATTPIDEILPALVS